MDLNSLADNDTLYALILHYPESGSSSLEFSGETKIKLASDVWTDNGFILLDCPDHNDIVWDKTMFQDYTTSSADFADTIEAKISWHDSIDSNLIITQDEETFRSIIREIAAESDGAEEAERLNAKEFQDASLDDFLEEARKCLPDSLAEQISRTAVDSSGGARSSLGWDPNNE